LSSAATQLEVNDAQLALTQATVVVVERGCMQEMLAPTTPSKGMKLDEDGVATDLPMARFSGSLPRGA